MLGPWNVAFVIFILLACSPPEVPSTGDNTAASTGTVTKQPGDNGTPVANPSKHSFTLKRYTVTTDRKTKSTVPPDSLRTDCETIFSLVNVGKRNPFAIVKEKASWDEVLSSEAHIPTKSTVFMTIEAIVSRFNSAEELIHCAYPSEGETETLEVEISTPANAKFVHIDTSHSSIETWVVGGLYWLRNSVALPTVDFISLDWYLKPTMREDKFDFFRLTRQSKVQNLADGCVARSLQFSATRDFSAASLIAILDDPSCPNIPLFHIGMSPIVSTSTPYNRPYALGLEGLIPFDPTQKQYFQCTGNFQQMMLCGEEIAKNASIQLEKTLLKGLPLYIKFTVREESGPFILTTAAILPNGEIQFIEAKELSNDDILVKALPK